MAFPWGIAIGAGLLGGLFGGRRAAPAPAPPREYIEALTTLKNYANFIRGIEEQEYQRFMMRRPEYERAINALVESLGYVGGKFTSPIYRPEVAQMVEQAAANEANVRRRLAGFGATPDVTERVMEALRSRAYERGLAVAGEQELGRRMSALQALGGLLQTFQPSGAGLQALSSVVGGYGGLADLQLRQQQMQLQREQQRGALLSQLGMFLGYTFGGGGLGLR